MGRGGGVAAGVGRGAGERALTLGPLVRAAHRWARAGRGGDRRTWFGDRRRACGCQAPRLLRRRPRTPRRANRRRRCARGDARPGRCAATARWTPARASSRPPRPTSTAASARWMRCRSEKRPAVVILGSGPVRIGQGIEFDACCVQAIAGLRAQGREAVMINCNPETVSTDWDAADRLYFEPLTLEEALDVIAREERGGRGGPVRRADPPQAREGPGGGGRADPRHPAGGDRPGGRPGALLRGAQAPRAAAARLRGRGRAGRGEEGRCAPGLPGAGAPILRAGRAGDGGRLPRGASSRSTGGARCWPLPSTPCSSTASWSAPWR